MYRLLIVEDEELERKALKMIIEKEFKDIIQIVGETGSGIEAVELDKKLKPHFILMDISIYGINGIEASVKIKRRDSNATIIILTAYDEFDFAHKAIRANVDDYILKPARPSRIIEAIKKQIRKGKINDMHLAPMLDELKINIKKADYKNSKYRLKDITNHIFNICTHDPQSRFKNLKEVINSLMQTALDLKIQNIGDVEVYSESCKKDIAMSYNQYTAQKSLMKMLDVIFNNITKNNADSYNIDINKILDYIEKNCKKNITLEEVSEFGSVSSYYLSKLFKRKVGINFSTYIINKKMEIAKELLENTDLPIINISLELSYNEPNYFSKVFKKTVGVTPTKYRNSKIKGVKEKELSKFI